MSIIKTAVFPVAGMGSRFLPVTKAGPKEMLPIIDKPLIQYVVEEAVSAGVTQLVFITSSSKRAIEDYFDTNYELERRLEEKGKLELLATVKNIVPSHVNFVYVRQPEPRGLGDAVLCAKDIVGQRPFAVLLADDIIDNGPETCLQAMVNQYQSTGSSVLAVERVSQDKTDNYGIVSLKDKKSLEISAIVEKPHPTVAPSNLAVTGRYILTPEIFQCLERVGLGAGNEVQLTDAIALLLQNQRVSVYPFTGTRFDCGSQSGFVQATLHYAMKDSSLKADVLSFLQAAMDETALSCSEG